MSFGPLTTVFTPSSECFETSPWPTELASSCYPFAFEFVKDRAHYSPGICPSGLTSAKINQAPTEDINDFFFPDTRAGETAIYCCQPGHVVYVYTSVDAPPQCLDRFSSSGTGDPTVFQTAVQVRWKESDLSVLETHPLSSGVVLVDEDSTISPVSQSASSTASASAESQSPVFTASLPTAKDGLNTGEIAGIAVGAVAGVACALAGAWLFIWKRRQMRRRRNTQREDSNARGGSSPSLDTTQAMPQHAIVDAADQWQTGEWSVLPRGLKHAEDSPEVVEELDGNPVAVPVMVSQHNLNLDSAGRPDNTPLRLPGEMETATDSHRSYAAALDDAALEAEARTLEGRMARLQELDHLARQREEVDREMRARGLGNRPPGPPQELPVDTEVRK
ncbi:hypothetical protein MKZ38_005771 [Zalerion maritima]|uniref:Uncharacterized protein n=1 Tax=Zalerion maritima TaxID=339359 RepID=A0AAD5RJR0_9PEZI|nr:hypothetical protein MKZ38_005771 [Zalerion maritima]